MHEQLETNAMSKTVIQTKVKNAIITATYYIYLRAQTLVLHHRKYQLHFLPFS